MKIFSDGRLFRFTALGCIFVAALSFAGSVFASATDGTIDGTNRYAWSESTGWIDFGTSEGGVHVTDSALSGYAYGETIGWISLNCSNTSSCGTNDYAVSNDGSGNLSGYAWGSNSGWVNFAPSGGGVKISSSGVFSGTAFAENIGWIEFGTDHPVTTDWRPSSSRSSGSSSSSGGGNGAPINISFTYGFVGTSTELVVLSGANATTAPTTLPPLSSPAASSTPATPHALFTIDRHLGQSAADVKTLQIFLNGHGALIAKAGPGSPGNETTYFGALTRAAVAAFQKAHGIAPSAGYFGPLTRGYINTHY